MSSELPRRRPQGRALLLLSVLLTLQVSWRLAQPAPTASAEALEQPPAIGALRIAALGEPVPLAGLLALRLQAFDNQPGVSISYAALDYTRVEAWLSRLLQLDPGADYPLLMASHLYAQVPDPARQRAMFEFTRRAFLEDPARRWPWLAHAALMAKHRLHDLPLALDYARTVAAHARGPGVPHWAQQMPIFLLEDMGEVEAAKIELGALLATGTITDPQEKHFLTERYRELEARSLKNRQQR